MNINFRFIENIEDINKCLQISAVNHYNELLDLAKTDMESSLINSQFVKPEFLILENENKDIIAFAGYANSGFDIDIYSVFWGNINPNYKKYTIMDKKEIAKIFLDKIKDEVKKLKGNQIICTSRFINFLSQFGFKEIISYGRESLLIWDIR